MASHSRNGRMKINISQEMIDQVMEDDSIVVECLCQSFPDFNPKDNSEQTDYMNALRSAIQYGDSKMLGETILPLAVKYMTEVVQYRMDRGDFDRDWWQNPESDRE